MSLSCISNLLSMYHIRSTIYAFVCNILYLQPLCLQYCSHLCLASLIIFILDLQVLCLLLYFAPLSCTFVLYLCLALEATLACMFVLCLFLALRATCSCTCTLDWIFEVYVIYVLPCFTIVLIVLHLLLTLSSALHLCLVPLNAIILQYISKTLNH